MIIKSAFKTTDREQQRGVRYAYYRSVSNIYQPMAIGICVRGPAAVGSQA